MDIEVERVLEAVRKRIGLAENGAQHQNRGAVATVSIPHIHPIAMVQLNRTTEDR
jgi:hypothetical protein